MIDEKTIAHVAQLARLRVTEQEVTALSSQLSKALGYFEEISKVPTDGVEPLVTPVDIEINWREDKAAKEISSKELMENAPDKMGNLFKVPPVV